MINFNPDKVTVPRYMRWVILAAFLFLALTPSRLSTVRMILYYLRWAPLFVLGAVALILAVRNRALPRPINSADVFILAFVTVALLSSLYSLYPETTILKTLSVLLMYGAIFWGLWAYADAYRAESLIRIMVTVPVIAIGLHVVFFALNPAQSFPYYGRLTGWADNPGTVGALMAITMPLVLWNAIQAKQWFWWALVGFMLAVVALAVARTEVIAIVIGSGYYLVRTFSRSRNRIFIVSGGLSLIAATLLWGQIGTRTIQKAKMAGNLRTVIPLELSGQVGDVRATDVAKEYGGETELTDGVLPDEVLTDGALPDEVLTDGVLPDEVLTDGALPDEVLPDGVLPDGVLPDEVLAAMSETPEVLMENEINFVQELGKSTSQVDKRYTTEGYGTLSGRTEKWRYGLLYFLERPLLGFGFGTEGTLFDFHARPSVKYAYTGVHTHNSYLGLGLELGLFGAALFYVPLAILILREFFSTQITTSGSLRNVYAGVVLTGMSSAFLSSWLYSMGNASSIVFWSGVMLLFRSNVQETLEK